MKTPSKIQLLSTTPRTYKNKHIHIWLSRLLLGKMAQTCHSCGRPPALSTQEPLCIGNYIFHRSDFPLCAVSVAAVAVVDGRDFPRRGPVWHVLAWRLRCHHHRFSPRPQAPVRSVFSPWLPPRATREPRRAAKSIYPLLKSRAAARGQPSSSHVVSA